MNLLSARPRTLRWLVPLAVVAVVGGGVALASASRSDSATPSLPPRTAEALLADVSQARVPGLSGTVVETARLGLPELPSLGGRGRASLTGLVSGSHTVRVWLKGEDRARLAVTGSLAESDVIRDRQDLWIYSSESNAVTHYDLTGAGRAEAPQRPPGTADGLAPALTPQEAVRQVLAAVTPSTEVQVERNARVAGRDAYQLRLRPKDQRSLIDSVVLTVDGLTKVPLRVQVLARGRSDPAFEVGFTQVQFRAPADEVFGFTPPPGARVTGKRPESAGAPDHRQRAPRERTAPSDGPAVLGSGWTSVLVVRDVNVGAAAGTAGPTGPTGPAGADGVAALRGLLRAATPVQGAFGHGRLLRTTLLTVLLTDGGLLYAGAVTPEAVQQAAGQPLSAARPLAGVTP